MGSTHTGISLLDKFANRVESIATDLERSVDRLGKKLGDLQVRVCVCVCVCVCPTVITTHPFHPHPRFPGRLSRSSPSFLSLAHALFLSNSTLLLLPLSLAPQPVQVSAALKNTAVELAKAAQRVEALGAQSQTSSGESNEGGGVSLGQIPGPSGSES